jgi:hypothetical protein
MLYFLSYTGCAGVVPAYLSFQVEWYREGHMQKALRYALHEQLAPDAVGLTCPLW